MDINLKKSTLKNNQSISISGSKSETNRLLLLQALYPELQLENISDSDDSVTMRQCLQSTDVIKNVHHAGTAMRFLSAYYAMQENAEVILTGSSRMKERPIKILVDALQQLGANITYLEKEGFPSLKIVGKNLSKNQVTINANVSSQYISALLLIGATLPNGIEIYLEGKLTSLPYIQMTLSVLNALGIKADFSNNKLSVSAAKTLQNPHFVVESDWSSASYFYSIVALSPVGSKVRLQSFKKNSLQGDAVLAEIYKDFGVKTTFEKDAVLLTKIKNPAEKHLNYDLNHSPDIAQTIIVSCLGLGITCDLSGLHTLKIKETDRLQALKNELEKFGADVEITQDSIHLKNAPTFSSETIAIETYQDHRMAMAFAPLALKQELIVKEAEVVSKSYPAFWNDLKILGFCFC